VRRCEARVSGGTEENNPAFEVGLALLEATLILIREQLVPVIKEFPDLTLPDLPPPSETCGKPAVEYVEHRDAKVWVCADHFDEYAKNPMLTTEMEDVLGEDDPEDETESAEGASN
jgi:hypothetical protein